MPIRFHCDHCRGTLSIARRKAYSLIDCPKCGSKLIVPSESKHPAGRRKVTSSQRKTDVVAVSPALVLEPNAYPVPAPEPPLFERPDFENLLNPSPKTSTPELLAPAVPAASPAPIIPAPLAPSLDFNRPAESSPSSSLPNVELVGTNRIVLSRGKFGLLLVLFAMAIVLAFGVGFLLARAIFTRPIIMS